MPVKKKSSGKKCGQRRSPKLVRAKHEIFDSQTGTFLLLGAALAFLVSFYYAQDRMTPSKSFLQASSAAAGLGK